MSDSTERPDRREETPETDTTEKPKSERGELEYLGSPSEKDQKTPLVQQVFLLLLGFILTGGVGTWLSTHWHDQEWEQQQLLLARKSALERKYEVATDVAKAIGEINAASLNVLSLVMDDSDKRRAREMPAARKEWEKAKQTWVSSSDVLLHKITVYFTAKPAPEGKECEGQGKGQPKEQPNSIFDRIINERHKSHVSLSNLLEGLEKNRWRRTDALKNDAQTIVLNLNDDQKKLSRSLMDAMAEQILAESSTSK